MNEYLTKTKVYKINIRGRLKNNWTNWFTGSIISIENLDESPNQTVITVRVLDQAELRGILNKLWDLNLTVLSINLHIFENFKGETNEY